MTSSNNLVRISADPISQEEVTQFVIDPSAGGISIFLGKQLFITMMLIVYDLYDHVGVTRDNFKGT